MSVSSLSPDNQLPPSSYSVSCLDACATDQSPRPTVFPVEVPVPLISSYNVSCVAVLTPLLRNTCYSYVNHISYLVVELSTCLRVKTPVPVPDEVHPAVTFRARRVPRWNSTVHRGITGSKSVPDCGAAYGWTSFGCGLWKGSYKREQCQI